MDAAVLRAVTSAAPNAAIAVAATVRSATCHVGVLHHPGGHYTRAAELFVDPGQETTMLQAIAAGLPGEWASQLIPTALGPRLQAQPTPSVLLQVQRLGSGWLVASATTGCVLGDPTPQPAASAATTPAMDAVLAALHTTAAETHRETLACAGGLTTTVAITAATSSADLFHRLQHLVPPNAHTFHSSSNRLAYRDDNVSVIAAASDDGTAATVRSTTAC